MVFEWLNCTDTSDDSACHQNANDTKFEAIVRDQDIILPQFDLTAMKMGECNIKLHQKTGEYNTYLYSCQYFITYSVQTRISA